MTAFSAKRDLGNTGEGIACMYLSKKGFVVIERNFLRPWGEIDIVCRKGEVLHFVEVKTISRATEGGDGSRGTSQNMTAEDHVHPAKLRRLSRTVETYMSEQDGDPDYQIDLVTVELDLTTRTARCKLYEQIL